MEFQRLYVFCPPGRADDLEAAADVQIRPGYLRLVRNTHQNRCVASLQATDTEAAQLGGAVLLQPGVLLIRGPDDDGPRPLDKLVDVGDTLPALLTSARYTWERARADHGVLPVVGPPLVTLLAPVVPIVGGLLKGLL